MNYLNHCFLVLVLLAMPVKAFDFNNSTASYDFTQTVEIFIVDQKNSKFFAMRDPFEMTLTTAPSRFYVAVMEVLQRGYANAEGVTQVQGAVVDYEYVLIFRSLNNSHVMFIGKNWVVDGNKKILLTAEEVSAIYEVLLWRSSNDQKMDMDRLEPLFKEINNQQEATGIYPKLTADDELKSILDSKKSLEARLPESHDDTKTLPYYNKVLENQTFREEQEKQKKGVTKSFGSIIEHDKVLNNVDEPSKMSVATPDLPIPPENRVMEKTPTTDPMDTSNNYIFITIILVAGIALLWFLVRKSKGN
ncbi:MAG TPA: hypothetical protein VL995_13685 [Cellvibrio sp.]|nr:hypothetical protein [Cellvibrio sp.]